MDPLQWLFITLALTLVFIVFAVNPLQVAIDEAIESNARFESRRIASVINIVSTAPDGTTYTLKLPNSRCTVKITDNLVTLKMNFLSGQEVSDTVGLLRTVPVAAESEFDCKTTGKIKISKISGSLKITRG